MPKFVLHCSGIKLARKDGLFGKSDPFVIIKCYGKPIAFSNVVMKNLNPFWDPIILDADACGGMNETVTIEVFDFDSDGKHDFIGSFSCTIQELVNQLNHRYPLTNVTIKKKKPQGHFTVTKVDVDNRPNALAYAIHFVGKSLARKDGIIGKSDPFLMIYTNGNVQGQSSDTLVFVGKTEYIKNDLNPVWQPLTLSVHSCGGMDTELIIRCYDYDSDGGHDLIGQCRTTLRQLVTSKPTLLLIEDKKIGKLYSNSGILSVGTATEAQPLYDDNIFRINVQFRGRNLDNKDTFSKSDPYLIIKRNETVIHRTPHIKNDLNPVWASFDLLVSDCGGLTEVLIFEVWDKDKTSDDLIGRATISLRHLLFWEKNPAWRLKNSKRTGIGKSAGLLEVINLTPFVSGPSSVASEHYRSAMQSFHPQPGVQQPGGYYTSAVPGHPPAPSGYVSNYAPPLASVHDPRGSSSVALMPSQSNEPHPSHQGGYGKILMPTQDSTPNSAGGNFAPAPSTPFGQPWDQPKAGNIPLDKKPNISLEKTPQQNTNIPSYMTGFM